MAMDFKLTFLFVVWIASLGIIQSIEAVEPMVLPTDNGSMNVEVTLNRETLEPDQQINFELRFLDPDGKLLEHVNYSFRIFDEKRFRT